MEYYRDVKIYSDGSHYIGIPHSENPHKGHKKKPDEELVEEVVKDVEKGEETAKTDDCTINCVSNDNAEDDIESNAEEVKPKRMTTRSKLFEELYMKSQSLPKKKRRPMIIKGMLPYFKTLQQTEYYVDTRLEQKARSLFDKKNRASRKAFLNDFNYFVTFTYDDKLHTEETFKKTLRKYLSNKHNRSGWLYIGVWERSPKNKRLHFHGIFFIPDDKMPGELVETRDYSTITGKMQSTMQNSEILAKFGRNDFEDLDESENRLTNSITYLLKYIEKTNEKLIYSRGLPMFYVCDILENDVVMRCGLEDKKLLLSDSFTCYDDGEVLGTIDAEGKTYIKKATN